MKIKNPDKDFQKTTFRSKGEILRALKEFYKKTKDERGQLSNPVHDVLRKTTSPEDLFLLNLRDEIFAGILDLSVYQSIVNNDCTELSNGFLLYARLNFYNRIPYQISDWIAVNSISVSDKHLLEIAYKKPAFYDNDDTDISFSLLKNSIRAIVFNNNDWKNEVISFGKVNYSSIASNFDRALADILLSIIKNDSELFSKAFLTALKLYSKSKWLSTYYSRSALMKHCPMFLLGLYNLASTNGIKSELSLEDYPLFSAMVDFQKTEKHQSKPFILFEGEIEFMNDLMYNDFLKKAGNTNSRIMAAWNNKTTTNITNPQAGSEQFTYYS